MGNEQEEKQTVTLDNDSLAEILAQRDKALIASLREGQAPGLGGQMVKQVTELVKALHGQVHLGRLSMYALLWWEITHYDKLANDASPDSLVEIMKTFFSFLGG